MQATKDSFYVALRDRLVTVDPERTITIDGTTRAAIAVAENEPPNAGPPLCDAFYLHWGSARGAYAGAGTPMAVECSISYRTKGSEENGSLDRGRDLGSLDGNLLAICAPAQAAKYDYSSGAAVDLGAMIFWTQPVLSPLVNAPPYIGREASVTIFFYPEVTQQ